MDTSRRSSTMLTQARYAAWREKMQAVKSLYVSRQYVQCTRYGERMLEEIREEIHPIHRAYLNFYTALSHDTLAREASLKNRISQLSLAEKHYMAAIAALTPVHQSASDEQPVSPTSCPSEEGAVWRLRRSSSVASSSSSSSPSSTPNFNSYSFPLTPATILTITSSRPQTPEEYQIAADTMQFVSMIRSHLTDVQELKQKTNDRSSIQVSTKLRMSAAPEGSTLAAKTCSADSANIRAQRVALKWRPRFDPSSVQQLCNEALAELY